MSQLSATEKLFGTTTLDERQAALARKTYALLGLAATCAVLGGYTGATSISMVQFFASPVGWIFALVAINVLPHVALWATRQHMTVALAMLCLDGFVSGLVLAPILFIASNVAPDILPAAGGVTLAAFVAVTGYMMVSRKRFSAPHGMMAAMAVSILAVLVLNTFLNIGVLGMMISVGIGLLGGVMLVYATSDVLNNPDFNNPVRGALMLFAALFNIFVSVLNILLRSRR